MSSIQPTQPTKPATATPTRRREPAYERVHDIHVLRLEGSFRDMGRQHGELLRDVIPHGPMPYYRRYVETALGKSLGPAAPVLLAALQRTIGRRVASRMEPYAEETLRGLAEGTGGSYEELLEGATMPDTLMWLAARMVRLRGHGPAVSHRIALGLGCTSAIAWGEATVDGKLLHARNFDYHGVGCWPSTTAVLFHEPDAGQRYVSVTAAGVPMGGVTAMNEAGLSLTVHQHMFTDRTRLGGTPIGLVGDRVMREAESLDDAERIFGEHTPIGCWTYLVTDGPRREVLCWEENPDRQVARRTGPEETTFGYANIFLDPELGESEGNLYGSYWRHNEARHRRANQRLADDHGVLDPKRMADILADTGDTTCRIAESIAMVMTVGSVVFQPEDGVVWVGTGEAPTSHGSFVPFGLDEEGHAPRYGTLEVGPGTGAAHEAFERYRRAYVAYLDQDEVGEARRLCDEAAELAPDQPLYPFMAGLTSLILGDARGAVERLDRALELGHPHPERRAAFHLWRGRALDLLGRRQEALRDYRWSVGHPADPPVRAAALRGLRRPFTARQARRVDADFSLADVIGP